MFSINPFAELSATVPPAVMQNFVLLMVALVVLGTLFDIIHKGSAAYFFNLWRKAQQTGKKKLGAGDMVSLTVQTAAVDVLTSAEFCNPNRRIAHLLTMYGFICYVVTTALLVFSYPTPEAAAPAILVALWYLGALMVMVGGFWFWFFIRADVYAEGHSPFRIVQADLFILSLLATVTFGFIWGILQASGGGLAAYLFLGLYLLSTLVLFGSIPWSKFSHMFFKPAAALQKRVEKATGSRRNLPPPADLPETLGNPRSHPAHY
ncbi:MAG: hypothetical protein Kow0032_20320 [Methyloligellaceae bacterium]